IALAEAGPRRLPSARPRALHPERALAREHPRRAPRPEALGRRERLLAAACGRASLAPGLDARAAPGPLPGGAPGGAPPPQPVASCGDAPTRDLAGPACHPFDRSGNRMSTRLMRWPALIVAAVLA